MNLKVWTRGLAAVLVLAAVACSDDKKPTAPVEEGPAPEEFVETFRGTLPQKREVCHFFTQNADGNISVKITDLQPLASLTVGLGIGTPSDTDAEGCSRFGTDDSARINEIFLSTGRLAGPYCTCIFDVGNIFASATVTYALEVTHN